MNTNIEENILIETRLLKTRNEVSEFERIIEEIFVRSKIKDIEILCAGFHDKTEHIDVTFSLVHAIEGYISQYSLAEYIETMLNSVPKMYPHAKEWINRVCSTTQGKFEKYFFYSKTTFLPKIVTFCFKIFQKTTKNRVFIFVQNIFCQNAARVLNIIAKKPCTIIT